MVRKRGGASNVASVVRSGTEKKIGAVGPRVEPEPDIVSAGKQLPFADVVRLCLVSGKWVGIGCESGPALADRAT
jgi:hypothetical protein